MISGDGHLEVPPTEWIKYVPKQYRELAPQIVTIDGDEAVQVPGNVPIYSGTNLGAVPPVRMRGASHWNEDGTSVPGAGNAAQRLIEQDRDNLEAEVLYPPLFMGRCIEGVEDKDAYRAMVSAYNEFVAHYCSLDPERLIGVGVLPNTGIEDGLAELNRISELGLRAVSPRWFPTGDGMAQPDDHKFWAMALELAIRVTPHSALGGPPNQSQRAIPGQPHNPEPHVIFGLSARGSTSMHVTLMQFLLSGVFDDFPELNIYFAEVNAGWLPSALSMLDDSYLLYKDHYGVKFDRPPSETILAHVQFGIVRDSVALTMVANGMIPARNIIWGSDFPHAVGSWPDSQAWLAKADLADEHRRMITRDNILDFLGVESANT